VTKTKITKRERALIEMLQYHLDGIGQDYDDINYTLEQATRYLKKEYGNCFESVLSEHMDAREF